MYLTISENLAPSELKKLRNKQRKARKKAERESAQAAQAQVKRDQHHKSRQQGDVEADTPQLDELIPDKLARVKCICICKYILLYYFHFRSTIH